MVDIIETDRYGIYYAINEGACTEYEFVKEVVKVSGVDIKVKKKKRWTQVKDVLAIRKKEFLCKKRRLKIFLNGKMH